MLSSSYEHIENSIKSTIYGITDNYLNHKIDKFQYMEQVHTCCIVLGTLCKTLQTSGCDKQLISRLALLRDELARPVMQMVYDQIQMYSQEDECELDQEKVYEMKLKRSKLKPLAG
ncbi:hypothetical protein [Paenibacillus gallinarum]|uniref:Uncharacterized protein n=1 Tax=Paenibacillus gallinarum TaxID=2762232 RepID=A0ABR8T4E0_9BACL|nr:hypothetical protein [Paenibacillus gallinarum]MBD7970393.1 hypothetical protein [Paenibacillus gallinarum]